MSDKTNSFWDDPDIQGWLHSVESDLLPKMENSAICLAVSDGRVHADMAVQIGAAILLDKPIVLVALNGEPISQALQRAATAIVRGSVTDQATKERLHAAISKALVGNLVGMAGMTLESDPDVAPWVYGILHGEPTSAGGFLQALAEAANRADPDNYPALRPALLQIMARYPKYHCRHEPEDAEKLHG